MIKTEVFTP